MHSVMIGLALAIALVLRWGMARLPKASTWSQRWHQAQLAFLLPCLWLLMTALAITAMGANGHMLGFSAHWLSYALAIAFIVAALGHLGRAGYHVWQTHQQLKAYPQIIIAGDAACMLTQIEFPYSARVGWWQSVLVISQGLLNTLNADQLQAVIAHEQAHLHYRDTFCFFWLGWLRSLTAWLPNTDVLWQELLYLREVRADQYAAQQVDPLSLAESLLAIAQKTHQPTHFPLADSTCAMVDGADNSHRLVARIESLLAPPTTPELMKVQPTRWLSFLLGLLPLFTIPFHG